MDNEDDRVDRDEYLRQLREDLQSSVTTRPLVRVFGYARFSTGGQHESSIERQEASITSYASRSGYTVERIFADRAVSGALSERAELDKLIALCGEFAGRYEMLVLIESMDRLVRSFSAFTYIFSALGRAGVEVHDSFRGRLDEFDAPIQAAFAAADRTRLVQRLNAGKRQLIERGGYMGPVPLGYRRVGTGMLAPDPEKSKLVLELFERRASGETIGAIVCDLNERKVPAPRGKHWNRSTLTRLLCNPIYIGFTARRAGS